RRHRRAQCARGSAAWRLCNRRRVVARRQAGPQVARQDRRAVRGASAGVATTASRMRVNGRFGRFGGCYVPEILVPALEQLEAAFLDAQDDPAFAAELNDLLANYAGRPTPLTRCRNLPGNIYLKREDLLHGGAHKTNQVLGQALLARRMGKMRLIAETGAGQHGVATAIVGALLGFETLIYMGSKDVERQKLNVFRMELMGARVIPVESGGRTLKDAINEALRDWSASFATTHYLLGTAAGPHPFPTMVREFQRVIGREARAQILEQLGRLPDAVAAGLDYPAVGPQHAHLKESGRAQYVGCTDDEALAAFKALAEKEGILCAFESAHALAHALDLAEEEPESAIVVGLSGRGDKDVAQAQALLA